MGRRKMALAIVKQEEPAKALLRLDLACGQRKTEGYTGVDKASAPGVDVIHDLRQLPWPFENESVEHVTCSHFVEHLDGYERAGFLSELYRILAFATEPTNPQSLMGKASLVFPYYTSSRAVQDFTHKWPPLCEQSFLYSNKAWREQNGLTHGDYELMKCDFDWTYGYAVPQDIALKNDEYRAMAIRHYNNAVDDLQVFLIKTLRPPGA